MRVRWGCHPKPRLGISSPNPISASRQYKGGTWQTQVKQAYSESGDASLPDSRFLCCAWGVRWGCCPKPCLRDNVPQTPFSASRRFTMLNRSSRAFPHKSVSIAECFAFCSETTSFDGTGIRRAIAQTLLGTLSPNPFFASRRFKKRRQGLALVGAVSFTEAINPQ